MNKFLIILIFVLVSNEIIDSDTLLFQQFQKFIKKYNKKYNSVNEFLARFEVFKSNVISVLKENSSHKTGITKFSDLTQQEFKKIYLNLNYDAIAATNFDPYIVQSIKDIPSTWDWREHGCNSSVLNQKTCGSNYAFVAMDILGCLYSINKGVSKEFSKQLLIDCDTLDAGCNGGLVEYALTWLKENGIMLESDYPYKSTKSKNCQNDPSKYVDMKVTGYKQLGTSLSAFTPVDEEEMKKFLYQAGPLSVGINGYQLLSYKGGIIYTCLNNCDSVNHVVVLVGYGHDDELNIDYWIIKNEWGEDWGEKGYARIAILNGICGINCYVISPLVSFEN